MYWIQTKFKLTQGIEDQLKNLRYRDHNDLLKPTEQQLFELIYYYTAKINLKPNLQIILKQGFTYLVHSFISQPLIRQSEEIKAWTFLFV